MIYRRIWLVVLILVFAVVAPAVVFYTAGYRWNAKKGVIERNGTLIIDTEPSGARIILNGQDTGNRTPSTRQDIAPGTYTIRLERDGYRAWEKTLDIRPERVTFAIDVWLWRQAEPTLSREATLSGIAAAPNARYLAFVEEIQGEARLVIQTIRSNEERIVTFQARAATGTTRLIWNDDSNGVLIEDSTGSAWVANINADIADHLPENGTYRWDGNTLIGVRPNERFTYSLFGGAVQQTPLAEGIVDEQGRYQITKETSGLRSIIEQGNDSRRFTLPGGAWTFAGSDGSWMFLRDERATPRWLAFRPNANDDEIRSVNLPAMVPPAQARLGGRTLRLTHGNGEIWVVELGRPAEILIRASQPITGAAWHTEGAYVFYATQNNVNVLGLDTRDGREQAVLASFEQITQMTLSDTDLYIVGTKHGKTGMWMLPTE